MTAPDWLSTRDGGLAKGLSDRTLMVTLNGHPQWRLDAGPAKGQFTCAVMQTNNGKRLDGGKEYPTQEAARGRAGGVAREVGVVDLPFPNQGAPDGEIERGDVVGILSVAGATALAGLHTESANAIQPPDKSSLFVVGRFHPGEWVKGDKNAAFRMPDSPTLSDVVEAVNRVTVYLLDRRVGVGAEACFADGFPRAMIQGELKHAWEKGDRAWEIHIIGVSVGGVDTDNRPNFKFRDVNTLTLHLWQRETDKGKVERESVSYFSLKGIRYDLTGRIRRT